MRTPSLSTTARYPILRVWHSPCSEHTEADIIPLAEVSCVPADQDHIGRLLLANGMYQLSDHDAEGETIMIFFTDRRDDLAAQLDGRHCRACGFSTALCVCVRAAAA